MCGRHHPSRGHSAGFLTFEAVIAYPYHPLAGRPVLVIGDHEYDGVHYFLIRQPQGGSFQVPAWMFDPAAYSIEIVTVPRLPVSQLLQLRHLVDRLVVCRLEEESPGGFGNETAVSRANGSVPSTHPTRRPERRRPPEGSGSSASIADGGGDEAGQRASSQRQKGSTQ
ncbi:hypothetical protein [Microvirga lotononidis]|uniref:hypothetical protein n=1 Tax=Microvirga lotononidis TaxID=864069 RepID=UPI001FD8A731|nr:hypothetical protein [Microvirga lotononidis]WQO30164.1 hypothetical protein U0023_27895 [Microvirga lotononidis]